jgi:hypothetical protein
MMASFRSPIIDKIPARIRRPAEGVAMTTEPAASPLQGNSLVGIGGGLVAILVAGYVCNLAGASQATTTGVMGVAIGVPAAVELQIKSRRRDTNVDIVRIQRGELRRPVGLVVMLLAAAIVLLDSGLGAMAGVVSSVLDLLVRAGIIKIEIAKMVGTPLVGIQPVILGMCLFLVASYASHYFAKRPYLWTATAVGCALAVRELVLLGLGSTSVLKSFVKETFGSLADMLVAEAVVYLGVLFICLVGAWLGTRYHDEFLAQKLARMEGKAARGAAKQHQSSLRSQTTATQASAQDSSAPQNSAPKLVTLVSRPNDSPSAPDTIGHGTSPGGLRKLAHLRNTGALTRMSSRRRRVRSLAGSEAPSGPQRAR